MLAAREHPAFSEGISTFFVGIEYLRGLGHELHAAEDDDVFVSLGSFAAELERVADEIRNRMEKRRLHVVVTEYDCVLLDFESIDLNSQLGFETQFKVRHRVRQQPVQLLVHLLNCLMYQSSLYSCHKLQAHIKHPWRMRQSADGNVIDASAGNFENIIERYVARCLEFGPVHHRC